METCTLNAMLLPFAFLEIAIVGLPMAAALAAVALIGYMFGQRTRRSAEVELDERRRGELERAVSIAHMLESIADELRRDLATHRARVNAFRHRLQVAQVAGSASSWEQVCAEAESMLHPTLTFALQLSHAYDQIRQQTGALETFTLGRVDPLTGVGTGRALDQHLKGLLEGRARGNVEFVIALVGVDRTPKMAASKHSVVTPQLPKFAATIRECLRDCDFVARLGSEEFVVVLSDTSLAGACIFAERLLIQVAREMSMSISCGIANARENDDSKSLLSRADSAFYSAKAAGAGRIFVHSGGHIREHGAASLAREATCDNVPVPLTPSLAISAPGECCALATPEAGSADRHDHESHMVAAE